MPVQRRELIPGPTPGELLEVLVVERVQVDAVRRDVYWRGLQVYRGLHPHSEPERWRQVVMRRVWGMLARLEAFIAGLDQGAVNEDVESAHIDEIEEPAGAGREIDRQIAVIFNRDAGEVARPAIGHAARSRKAGLMGGRIIEPRRLLVDQRLKAREFGETFFVQLVADCDLVSHLPSSRCGSAPRREQASGQARSP